MLWTILVSVFIAVWGWGYLTGAAGRMIHLLLIAALATALMGVLLSGRRSPL